MSEMSSDAQGSADVPTADVPTAERRRAATVSTAPDGLPIVTFDEPMPVSNEAAVAAIRDTRISVSAVLGQMAAGRAVEDIVADLPQLDREDVLAALAFAAASLGPEAAPDADFPARLQRSIEENREVLDRLAR